MQYCVVEDIRHGQDTQERLDKAAATQMVFEDALIHIIDHLIRMTGSDRLVLTGGRRSTRSPNAVAGAFRRGLLRAPVRPTGAAALWVPPTPNDAG